jgi:hypothetical protein
MQRIKYKHIKNLNILRTNDLFNDTDFLIGEIDLNVRPFEWVIKDSNGEVIEKGIDNNLRKCKDDVKNGMIKRNVVIEKEFRKYKI